MISFTCQLLDDLNIKSTTKIYISGSNRPNEGEFKIFEHLYNTNQDLNTLIVCDDSDITSYSFLAHSEGFKNIHIMRLNEKKIVKIDPLLQVLSHQLFDSPKNSYFF